MRLVKLILGVGLLVGLVAIGSQRDRVLAAYSDGDERPEKLAFAGLDLDVGLTPMGDSPYVVDRAPDSRTEAIGLTVQTTLPPALTLSGGSAALSGIVMGPSGPVAGASVRIERHAGDGLAAADLVTDELGAYHLPAILGGRYRVRAWVGGQYTMTTSAVLFLRQGEVRALDLEIGPIDGQPQVGFTHRGDVYVGLTGSVAVSVTTRSIGADGLVDLNGIPGAVVGFSPSANVTANAAVVTANGAGVANFLIECHQPGPATATITYANLRATATLPNCRPVPAAPAPTEPGTEEAAAPSVPRDLVHETLVTEIIGAG